MKALAGTGLVLAVGWAACSTNSGQSEGAPPTEGVGGASGSSIEVAKAGGSGASNLGGNQGPGGGGAPGSGGSGGISSITGAGGAVATTPCPPDNVASCPKIGGFTPPCGSGHCIDASGKPIVQTTTYDTCHPD